MYNIIGVLPIFVSEPTALTLLLKQQRHSEGVCTGKDEDSLFISKNNLVTENPYQDWLSKGWLAMGRMFLI